MAMIGRAESTLLAPPGFSVTLFSDDELAHDIYCMTVDDRGRVVVSGAGYIRLLHDDDGDGRADRATLFADGPRTGAQGILVEGHRWWCVGDGGLLRYQDEDGDGHADGPPEVILPLRTGGEHHAHAVRRGPDGWLYVIAGNDTGIDNHFVTSAFSPVQQPRAGTLLRLAPAGDQIEVVCDGLRNAYDFDFDPWGRIYFYDSDDERDVSFPWYRPTRVFQVLAGGTAGWVSRSWKLPDYAFDMMPVVASLGRGSPTGVCCYRHRAFPAKYHGALFVADWTFGRVVTVWPQYEAASGRWSAHTELFLTSDGSFGFAPTDLVVGRHGEMYVSVGGRGTRGAVFCVRWVGHAVPGSDTASEHRPVGGRATRDPAASHNGSVPSQSNSTPEPTHDLVSVLDAPEPHSAWSRAQWLPRARCLGRQPFVDAVLDDSLPVSWRVRAIEILCELFDGLPSAAVVQLGDAPPDVRMRAAWCWIRCDLQVDDVSRSILKSFLNDADAQVVRAAVESLTSHPQRQFWVADERLRAEWLQVLAHPARDVRQQAAYLFRLVPTTVWESWVWSAPEMPAELLVTVGAAYGPEGDGRTQWVRKLWEAFPTPSCRSLLLDAVRVLQWQFGDVGPAAGREAVFDGYAPHRAELLPDERLLKATAAWFEQIYPTNWHEVDHELERLAAQIGIASPSFRSRLLQFCTDTSEPVDDIHRLVVMGRLPGSWSQEELTRLADIWARIEAKVAARRLPQDRHWPLRWEELWKVYLQRDPRFAARLLEHPSFGQPGHAYCLRGMPDDLRELALARFWSVLDGNPEMDWPVEVILAASRSHDLNRNRLIQRLSLHRDVDAIIGALAEQPRSSERSWYWQGLRASTLSTVIASLHAIERLGPADDPQEVAALLAAWRTLEGDKVGYEPRERIARLLERIVPECFGFVFGPEGYRPQPEMLDAWRRWLEDRWPESAASVFGISPDTTHWQAKLERVPWQHGEARRGELLAHRKACTKCHSSRYALGPDLAGVANRFTRTDLFLAIAFPNKDVSPRYRTRVIETAHGKVLQGAVIYESVQGVLLATPTGETIRVEAPDIVRQHESSLSLMPSGLLDDCTENDLADLYAWLQALK